MTPRATRPDPIRRDPQREPEAIPRLVDRCAARYRLCFIPLLVLAWSTAATAGSAEPYRPREGDIVFHTSTSTQSVAIQKATKSRYSHVGIVFLVDGKPVVLEAVEPVKTTPLASWLDRGQGRHFVVKRLRDADQVLTSAAMDRLRSVGMSFLGTHYDLVFEWSDERLYCSELVWKVFDRALGLRLGKLQTISDFDLSDPVVQAKVKERWGGAPPPAEVVVSPASVFTSEILVTVYEN